MAISKLQPVSTASTPSAFSVTITTANYPQKVVRNVTAGVYTVSVSPTSSTATVSFISGNTFIGFTTTSSGSITYNLASDATAVFVQSNNANDVVTINLTASAPLNTAISGTLDTITSSGTYTQTGLLWVLAIGGGGGGAGAGIWSGGGAGGLAMFYGNVTGSTTVTIGNAGTGGSIANAGTSGGTTSFGSYAIATGGTGNSTAGTGTTGSVTSSGGAGGAGYSSTGGTTVNVWRAIKNGTYGGGAGGWNNGTGGQRSPGGDGVIGTGGQGGTDGQNGGNASGYGSGGGGGLGSPGLGGNGSPGVVYVLRGF